MRISVIVPTYRRPQELTACLDGLRRQNVAPLEVLVVHRADDAETVDLLSRRLPAEPVLRALGVGEPGVVAALNRGLEHATGDVVAMTDDDAVPRPDWIERLANAYRMPRIGGAGGRDVLHFAGATPDYPLTEKVGYTTWYGKTYGNFHCAGGTARAVEMLKGVNMSFRRAAIGSLRFDARLMGEGAQIANEMMFSFAVRRAGWELIVDPQIVVDHYPAQRHEIDQRTGKGDLPLRHLHHNVTLCFLEHAGVGRTLASLLWRLLIGARKQAGLATALWYGLRDEPGMFAGLGSQIVGDWWALRTWWRTRPGRGAPDRRATPFRKSR